MKNARRSPWALLYKFHRYSGLVAAVIILILAVTGILLNHTDDLHLDNRFVASDFLLDWYGIEAPKQNFSYPVSDRWISKIGNQVYLDTLPVFNHSAPLTGAVQTGEFIVVAFSNALLLLSSTGEVIEQINKKPIRKIAVDEEHRIFIQSDKLILFSNDDLMSWHHSEKQSFDWALPSSLPANLEQQLKKNFRVNILPLERVILDIHSGRFFGRYGVYVVDFAAILMILLTLSGVWIWVRHKFKRHRKR